MNHLEQIVGEWYEYNGYFVRRNVLVGRRSKGGYKGELDVIAFHPGTKHLVHIEPTLDAHSWAHREKRFKKKFQMGRKYIPQLFSGVEVPNEFDQIALFVFGSNANVKKVGGGIVATAAEFYASVVAGLRGKRVASKAIPEQFPLLRTVQHCIEYEGILFGDTNPNQHPEPTLRFAIPE